MAQIGLIEECRNLLKKIVCFQEVKAVNILTAPLSCNILEPKPCRMLCSTDPIEGQDLPPMLWPQFIFITFYYCTFEGLHPFHYTIKYPHLVRLVCRIPPHPPRLFQQLHSTARSPGRVGRCEDFADGQGDLKGPQPPWRMIDSVDIIIIWLVVFFTILKNNEKY